MKRLLALVMALGLALWALPGLAEEPVVEAAPVEAQPEELEVALGAFSEGNALVSAAEDAGTEAYLAPAETTAPEETVAPEATAAPEATPAPIALNAEEVTLGLKESFTLAAEGEPGRLRYSSNNAKVAKVNSKGKITGKGKGDAVVTVTAADGRSAMCRVQVLAAPKSLSLNVKSVKLGYDAKKQLGSRFTLAASLPDRTASAITYVSGNPSVVQVTDTGELIAAGRGKTTVTAATFNGVEAKVKVTVKAAPKKVKLDRTELKLFPGETYMLKPTLTRNSVGDVRFESSNPAVVGVDAESGALIAIKRGSAVITATSFNGKKGKCAVRVSYTPRKIKLEKTRLALGLGETFALAPRLVNKGGGGAGGLLSCESDNPAVATVDGDGTVKAVSTGTAKIVFSVQNGVTASCAVTVMAVPQSVRMSAKQPKLTVGGKTALAIELTPGSASQTRAFSGYDEAVVQVTEKGTVKAVGPGDTRITVTTFNGLEASCHVRVLAQGSRRTLVVAHRGGAGDWPENSLTAFRNAPSTGADQVELDVRTARDGTQVVHHDATFTVKGRRYTIEKLTLEQIKALDEQICTLDEALEVINASGLTMQLEMKDSANPEACVQAVERHGMQGRVDYISFYFNLLYRLRALRPEARIGLLLNQTPKTLDADIEALRPIGIYQKAVYLSLDNLAAWQNRGLRVGSWTLDDAEALRYWCEAGADYITSNDPRLAVEIVEGIG